MMWKLDSKYYVILDENIDGDFTEMNNGTIAWHNEEKSLHRENRPARMNEQDKRQEWWFNGKLHRVDGPAIVSSGGQEWWVNGKRHRRDGPAVIRSGGEIEWWFESKIITPQELFEQLSDEEKQNIIWDLDRWK